MSTILDGHGCSQHAQVLLAREVHVEPAEANKRADRKPILGRRLDVVFHQMGVEAQVWYHK